MSFTGNATYAELYPSRSPDDEIYRRGSVFLVATQHRTEIYELCCVNDGLLLMNIVTGNKWSNLLLPRALAPISGCKKLHIDNLAQSFQYGNSKSIEFIGMARDVLSISVRDVCAGRTANGVLIIEET